MLESFTGTDQSRKLVAIGKLFMVINLKYLIYCWAYAWKLYILTGH